MSRKRVLATTLGTVSCAFAIGFVMQQGNAPAPHAQASTPRLAPEPVAQMALEKTPAPGAETIETAEVQTSAVLEGTVETIAPELELDKITLTSIDVTPVLTSITSSLLEAVALDTGSADPGSALAPPMDPSTPFLGCAVRMNAQPVDMAHVRLTIDAPCNANERVMIHHTGMMFSKVTSQEGRIVTTVPALAETAIFIAQLENGAGAVESVEVGSLENFERIALQWSGPGGFQIHAREFGAAYGAPGHVWTGSELAAGTGQIVRLGDMDGLNPNIVEIYTYPVERSARQGTVAISIEAEVTDANCGRDIAAQSIELRTPIGLRTRDLVLTMPDCSAVGDFLVLNNLVDDLRVASR